MNREDMINALMNLWLAGAQEDVISRYKDAQCDYYDSLSDDELSRKYTEISAHQVNPNLTQADRFLAGEVELDQLLIETVYLMIQQHQLSFDQFEDWVYLRDRRVADELF